MAPKTFRYQNNTFPMGIVAWTARGLAIKRRGSSPSRFVPAFITVQIVTHSIRLSLDNEGTIARHPPGAPGIQINVPAMHPNALPPSYQAWCALFTIAKAHVIHALLEQVVANDCNDNINLEPLLALLGTKISAQIPLCWARSENPIQTLARKRLEMGR